MIKTLLDTLSSRRMSLALMLFVSATGVIGATVPQRATTSTLDLEAWLAARPMLAPVVVLLGLDRVFSTWWFLGALVLFTISLTVATVRMARLAGAHTRGRPSVPSAVHTGIALSDAASRASQHGYRESGRAQVDGRAIVRFTRHRGGWWGTTVLHAGMLIVVLAACAAAAFSSRAVIDLSQGEVWEPGGPLLAEESGVLASRLDVGRPLRLEGAETSTWESGELKTLRLDLSVGDDRGGWEPVSTSVNAPLRLGSHTLYASAGEFGEAAFLRITGSGIPETRARMEFGFVPGDAPAYADVVPPGLPGIEGRWDPERTKGEELLTLRYTDESGTEHRAGLAPGESAVLGEYSVEFVLRGAWARVIVVRDFGVRLLFLGFAVIGLGSILTYIMVPREIVLADDPAGIRYSWCAARMGRSYARERDEILGRSMEETR